jgi:purine-binding chemotaxis protein CheW
VSDSDTALAEPVAAEPLITQDNQFVTFSVSGEMFAVPMGPVQEIIRVPDVARLPLAPPSLAGLANLRGRVLPIVNLREIFNSDAREHDDATRALVIDIGQPLGFVVDKVSSVISVEPGEMEPAAAVQSVANAAYLTGVIRREQPDGSTQLLMALDFQHLVEQTFNQMRSRASGGSGSGGGASLSDTSAANSADAVVSDELRLVSFTVADQEYAIDIADVQEIVQVPERITGLPNTPHHCLGVISLRQRLLPLVSLRALFSLPMHELDEHHRIVVVSLPGRGQVGLVTDAVKEVLSVPRSQSDSMPGILSRGEDMQEFSSICRLEGGKRLVSIIDSEKLLGMSTMQDVMTAAGTPGGENNASGASMSNSSNNAAPTDDDAQVVIFRLGAEEFGVPIMSVQEIVRVPESLTRVPKTPAFVEGVINLRGTVLPVIDQRVRLGMTPIERNDRQRIMVYTLGNGMRTGFIVDSVAEVLRIPRGNIERSPELSDEQARLISQVAKLDKDKRLVMLIDPSQLLGGRELGAMQSMMDSGNNNTTGEQRLAA